ncbi:hypothetical protein [Sphingomonas sp. BAUL-RG-20F-R05-02]|uniref:hypothetical protein n=1 Tax=Sphingomonas sp. BAUL-RG-20F-R05-02 TaxID=2914830 RepID=UPI001F5831E8|nr:hypothetical protein [Sphingomonas sp. BAUL-RG-20F-R05-02]
MNRWVAVTMTADHQQGGRFYVMEAMHFPGYPRPPYAAGDAINIDRTNLSQIGGIIQTVTGRSFAAGFTDGTRLEFSPTPPSVPAPSLQSQIPFDDMMGRPI